MRRESAKRVLCGAAACDVAAFVANLVLNPDFDNDLQGWRNSGTDPYSWDSVEGAPAPGSIHFAGPTHNYFGAVASDCIAIQPSQKVDLLVNVKVGTGSARAQVMADYTTDCFGGTSMGATPIVSAGPGWQQLSLTNVSIMPGMTGVVVRLYAYGDTDGNVDVHFDHIQLFPSVVPVTLQSFDVQ